MGKDSKWFAKLDALHGYYQIPLALESQKLTAFLLPQGRFYYRVAPMGLNPSGDWWGLKSDEAIAGLSGMLKLVDDILVHAPSLVELRGRIRGVLQRCRAHGIVLSKKKFEIGRQIHFVATISQTGASSRTSCHQRVPHFAGSQPATQLSRPCQPVGELPLRSGGGDRADERPPQETDGVGADARPRAGVCGQQEASYVGPHCTILRPTAGVQVGTDASRSGIGFALNQEGPDGQKRLVTCGSRGLNLAEARYAPVELECLGGVYAIQKTENSSGFHVLEIHMPSMGTGMGMLLLVGAAILALRWWVQRRHVKKLWLQGGFHGQAYEMGCLCHPRHLYPLPNAWGGRDRWPVRGAALGSGCPPPLLPPAAPLGPLAGPAIVPGG